MIGNQPIVSMFDTMLIYFAPKAKKTWTGVYDCPDKIGQYISDVFSILKKMPTDVFDVKKSLRQLFKPKLWFWVLIWKFEVCDPLLS